MSPKPLCACTPTSASVGDVAQLVERALRIQCLPLREVANSIFAVSIFYITSTPTLSTKPGLITVTLSLACSQTSIFTTLLLQRQETHSSRYNPQMPYPHSSEK